MIDEQPTSITTLPNGMRVVSELLPRVETAAVGVWVDVGTRYERAEVNGVAHMLEHMAFKGTTTRSARAIAEQIENVGGALNAYTSREHTAYYARVLAGDVPLATELIADILRHSTFDATELEKERHVILQEIGQVQDTPDDLVFDLFQEVAFPDQAMGRSILGPEKIVAAMPREAMVDYMGTHYVPSRMVLAAAGKVEHDRLVELAQKLFGDLPAGTTSPPEPAAYRGGRLVDSRKDLEQVHLCIGWQGLPWHDPDHYALQVLSTALGGGMSSRLFQEVRENRGLCYSVFTFASAYADTGLFGVYAGTGAKDIKELMPVVAEQTALLLDQASEEEVARARAQLKAGVLMALESCSAVCEELARQVQCYGRRVSTQEIVARIDAVDAAAVRRVGKRVLGAGPATLTALGPVKRLPKVAFDRLAA
ncbi:MAG: pitrilysin family protein [Geminicoccaceae bacterium]